MADILTYRIRLDAPLIITRKGGDQNSSDTQFYIPGSASRYLASHDTKDPTSDAQFRRCFLSNSTRFLNLCPCDRDNRRMMPTPVTLKTEKGKRQPVLDLASDDEDIYWDDSVDPPLQRQLQAINQAFAIIEHPSIWYFTPQKTVRFHHRRNRLHGRPTKGDIFTYASLEKDQFFKGHVIIEDNRDVKILDELFANGNLSLGRSRHAEYGGFLTLVEKKFEENPGEWKEIEISRFHKKALSINNTTLVVTLLSDYITAGHDGQAVAESLLRELRGKMGAAITISARRMFTRYNITGGYLKVWHLPRPQFLALGAGSVFVLTLTEEPPAKVLEQIEWEGLGERRNEGFGRIRFNLQGGNASKYSNLEKTETVPYIPAQAVSGKALSTMQKQFVKGLLDRLLLTAVQDIVPTSTPALPRSTIGKLRTVVRNAWFNGDAALIASFVNNASGKPALDKMNRMRVQGERLPQWIKKMLEEPEAGQTHYLWTTLGAIEQIEQHPIGNVEDMKEMLEEPDVLLEYRCRLIDAVLVRFSQLAGGE